MNFDARRPIVLGVLVAALAASTTVAAARTRDASVAIDRIVAQAMRARGIPGVAVAVVANGRIVEEKAYGLASVELRVPVTPRTLFVLSSTTKEFTGVAVMKLVEEGRLSLDAPVRSYLPELPASWAPVTLRHCLAHTSGLPDANEADQVNVIPLAGERDKLLALLAARPLQPPGMRSVYNQTEFMLLGMVVERVSAEPFTAFVDRHLLAPIGVDGMRWGDAWQVVPGRAALYTTLAPTADRSKLQLDDSGRPVVAKDGIHAFGSKVFPDWAAPTGSLNADIHDMAVWEAALTEGRVIRPETYRQMSTADLHRDGSPGDYGLALIPDRQDGHATVSSGGGAAVWLTRVPDQRLTVIVLTNLQGSSPQTLVADILQVYLDAAKAGSSATHPISRPARNASAASTAPSATAPPRRSPAA